MLRLDRFLTSTGAVSRKEAALAVRRGEVTVDGAPLRDPAAKIDETRVAVALRGVPITFRRYLYVMLNKPSGYVSATDDRTLPCVLELLSPEHRRRGLFPVGRLDRDTTGLLILTDDGETAHRLLSPKRGIEKVYRFTCANALSDEDASRLRLGIAIDGGEICRPAYLCPDPGRLSGTVTLTEGKYHEVKRMFRALGNEILTLERISFAGLPLDFALPRGAWRELTDSEVEGLLSAARRDRTERETT